MSSTANTIDDQEVANFTKDAAHWWDIDGPFAPLHKLNPTRVLYIKQQILRHYGINSLKGITVLDVGCGGGLVCEPLTRLGASVTGADADSVAIDVATEHADDLDITYINKPAEEITEQFDVVLALEIIEHVSSPQDFVTEIARLVKPGGLVIFSTLNRTLHSFALAKVAAEYILRWVPAGTHDWKKFIKPSEFARMARAAGLYLTDTMGLHYNPLTDEFSLSPDAMKVNYLLSTTKPKD